MPLTIIGKNAVLETGKAGINRISLHTGPPGLTGENEISGSPYTRQEVVWKEAVDGIVTPTLNPIFDIPVGNFNVTHVGFWSGSKFAGTSDTLTPVEQPFTNGGQFVITSAPLSLI